MNEIHALKISKTKQLKALIKLSLELNKTYTRLITFLYVAQKSLGINYESDVKKIEKRLERIRNQKCWYEQELKKSEEEFKKSYKEYHKAYMKEYNKKYRQKKMEEQHELFND